MSGIGLVPLLNAVLVGVAILCSIPLLVLAVECVAATFSRRVTGDSLAAGSTKRPRVAVLIPAYNEHATLGGTLDAIKPQLLPGERLLVVADNCTDDTAAIARARGAEVAERTDAVARGKGFALDFGMRQLASDPPEVIVLTDADCTMHDGSIDALARQVATTGRPAQALYLLERPASPTLRDSISAFAFLLKNQVRPLGLNRAGLPCPLFGAGMAFPWQVLRDAPLADGNIVEDLQLGLNLVLSGHPPLFCGAARVIGNLPTGGSAALIQRKRWEHGHLRTIFSQAPRLLAAGIRRFSLAPVVVALDVAVPPLSLLTVGVILLLALSLLLRFAGGSSIPLFVLSVSAAFALAGLAAAWFRFGRQTLPATSLLAVPLYIAWKVPMYFAFLLRPQKQWVRTARTPDQSAKPTEAFLDNSPGATGELPH